MSGEQTVAGRCRWSAKEQAFLLTLQEVFPGMELLSIDRQPPILIQKYTEQDLDSLVRTLNQDRTIKMGDKDQVVFKLSTIGAYGLQRHLHQVLVSYRYFKSIDHPALKNPNVWEVRTITPEKRKELLDGRDGD